MDCPIELLLNCEGTRTMEFPDFVVGELMFLQQSDKVILVNESDSSVTTINVDIILPGSDLCVFL